jgi:hypothetical protein
MPRPKRTKIAPAITTTGMTTKSVVEMKKSRPAVSAKSKEAPTRRNTRQRVASDSSTPDEFKMSKALPIEEPKQVTAAAANARTVATSCSDKNQKLTSSIRSKRTRATPQPTSDISKAPTIRSLNKDRASTPVEAHSSDSDLYGLSPGGEASRAKLEAQQASRRASLIQPQSAIKALGTPAVENSILALNRFKRRNRQPSIIRLMQEASELGNTDDFDLDDFDPEDESTPLYSTRKTTNLLESEPRSSSSRKRKHSEMIKGSTSSLLSSPPPSSPTVDLPVAAIQSTERPVNDDTFSDTMAPPLSSSSDAASPPPARNSSNTSKSSGDNTRRRRQATKIATNALQSFLPKVKMRRSQRQHTKPSQFDLSNSSQSAIDILDTNSEASEQPEEETPKKRNKRGTVSTKPQTTQKTRPVHKNAPGKRPLGEKNNVQTPSVQKISKDQTSHIKPHRKYGKRITEVEKENEHDDSYDPAVNETVEDNSIAETVKKTKEITKMKDKFAEIDDWEMEFESVDVGGDSSSPWR